MTVTTSDGTATAGSDYDSGSGELRFFSSADLTTTGQFLVIGDFEEEGLETFTVSLSNPFGMVIGDGVGVAKILNTPAPPPVTFGGRDRPLTYTRPDRGPVSISLKGPGTGSAFIAPGAVEPTRLVFDATTAATTLTVTGDAALPDTVVNGSLRVLTGRNTDLVGHVRLSGSLSRLLLDDVERGGVTIGGGDRPLTLVADQVGFLDVNTAAPIRSLRVNTWRDGGLITTPLLSSLTVATQMHVSVNAGAIGRVTAASISASTLRAERSIGSVSTNALTSSRVFAGVSPGLVTLPDSLDDFVNPLARVGTVAIRDFRESSVAAPKLGRLELGAATGTGPFSGVAGRSIRSLSAVAGADALRFSKLDDPADSRTIDRFVMRLL